MIQCQSCGQVNSQTSNFCRFCGTHFAGHRSGQNQPESNGGNYEFSPPRPYSWKTDEFKINEKKLPHAEPVNRVQPLNNFNYQTSPIPNNQPLVQYQPQQNQVAYGYRCPRCASQLLPKVERKISTAGWIVFSVLMVTFFPLFWIGLLIKEDVKICPICNLKIN